MPEHPTQTPDQTVPVDERELASTRTALKVFRVMSFVAGTALFVLILEMVLKYGFSNDVLAWWSPCTA